MNIRFYLFVSDVNQGNEDVQLVQDFRVYSQGWKTFQEKTIFDLPFMKFLLKTNRDNILFRYFSCLRPVCNYPRVSRNHIILFMVLLK